MVEEVPPPRRRTIRLPTHDYRSQGAYFVTICTFKRVCLFGDIVDGDMHLSAYGDVAQDEWWQSGQMRREIVLDEFVVMPNHLHAIVFITEPGGVRNDECGASGRPPDAPTAGTPMDSDSHGQPSMHRPASRSLGALINGYKAAETRTVRSMRGTGSITVWQRNYFEHVIRNEDDLDRIRQYIRENPRRGAVDRENPDCTGSRKP